MKKSFVALSLLLGATAVLSTSALASVEDFANGDVPNKLKNAQMERQSRALRTSAPPGVDTTWVGHKGSGALPNSGAPWFIGTGPNQPSVSPDGYWGWDNHAPGANDSLQGWWPFRRIYGITGGLTLPDNQRPWWAIDIGNQSNYVLNSRQQNRTKGVLGIWHVDGGNTAPHTTGGPAPTFAPIAGAGSAWCGLRAHGDLNYIDPVTGNHFNQTVTEFTTEGGVGSGTSKNYPGYGSQIDQMLYRDVQVNDGANLNLSFDYATQMSTGLDAAAATRTGWFDKDPLSLTAGNFISSTAAGANAPVDSFMVYIGAPANLASSRRSDGINRPVYDPQRRWFSEVLDITTPGTHYRQVLSVAGINPVTNVTRAIPNAMVQPILDAQAGAGGIVRLVFRVKTNRGFDDEGTAFSSGGQGAARVDNVNLTGGVSALSSGFDLPSEINNTVEGGGAALTAWKSTGKPPAIYFHTHPLDGGDIDPTAGVNFYQPLTYNDLCGPYTSPARFCNIGGVVFSIGDHDNLEKAGGNLGTAEQEVESGFISPTINLVIGDGDNDSDIDVGVNALGIDNDDVEVTDDYYIWYDFYAGIYNLFFTGNAWQYGFQSYPAQQPGNGHKVWGSLQIPGFQYFNPDPQCFSTWEVGYGVGLVRTSNATGYPDSVRILFANNQQCFRFAVSLGCSPDGGGYFDNLSFGMVDAGPPLASSGAGAVGNVSVDIWRFINDAFPANDTPGLPGTAAFDTAGAWLATGINNAQTTGDANRFDLPGDTTLVIGTGAGMRMDMVFRILPGPGNYMTIGNKASGLRRVPQAAIAAAPGDGSFWGEYLASNDGGSGFGSAGGHGGAWNQNVWNSARMDTQEVNYFPVQARGQIQGVLTSGIWAAMYHESDPKFATLGITKNRCFLIDTSTAGAINSTNTTCGTGTYPPAWVSLVPASRTGYPGTPTTQEYTKIIPDGLLTAGAHVQYFFRKHEIATGEFVMVPDTNIIFPQAREGSNDGHRFQQFGVLPDRWKDAAFGGAGPACMLYVDLNDRRGNERVWVGVADSIGATQATKWGAHNGWHAGNNYDYSLAAVVGNDPTIAVWSHGGQPGTTWDMYGVKASESLTTSAGALGSRLSTTPTGLAAGKGSRQGPTPEMLRTYYRILMILTGDLNSGILGPFVNRSQNDVAILQDYLATSAGSAQPRGMFIQGNGFVESETQTAGVDPSHGVLLSNFLATTLRNGSYQSVSANLNDVADLMPTTIVTGLPGGDVLGVQNSCAFSNDLLDVNVAVPGATAASFYENVGTNGPYVASVYAPSSGPRPYITLVDGWEIEALRSRFDETGNGRLRYFWDVFANVFGSICAVNGNPLTTLDVPSNSKGSMYMALANNPLRSGQAVVKFGLPAKDRVQVKVYDVNGRLVRTLADREFEAGDQSLLWDGTNNDGQQVARGVYFTQVKFAKSDRALSKKITVLQ